MGFQLPTSASLDLVDLGPHRGYHCQPANYWISWLCGGHWGFPSGLPLPTGESLDFIALELPSGLPLPTGHSLDFIPSGLMFQSSKVLTTSWHARAIDIYRGLGSKRTCRSQSISMDAQAVRAARWFYRSRVPRCYFGALGA